VVILGDLPGPVGDHDEEERPGEPQGNPAASRRGVLLAQGGAAASGDVTPVAEATRSGL
jgi:hypothetical protein